MPVSVEIAHPTGLEDRKIVGKMVNGTSKGGTKHDETAQQHSIPSLASSDENINGVRQQLGDDDKAVLAVRNLIFDICNQNGGGHGGSALGMAAIGVALYKYVMRYNPSDPSWFDRDRFVLSNGK